MSHDFWIERWATGQIGWHQNAVNPALLAYHEHLCRPGDTVFVPLCGASIDMAWLAESGRSVIGCDLAEDAIRRFFSDRGLSPMVEVRNGQSLWRAGAWSLLVSDIFTLDAADVGPFAAIYDRAAMIALEPQARSRYAALLSRWSRPGVRQLLLTLDYDQDRKPGPPYAVPDDEVYNLYSPFWAIEQLERKVTTADDPLCARGLDAFTSSVFLLTRRG